MRSLWLAELAATLARLDKSRLAATLAKLDKGRILLGLPSLPIPGTEAADNNVSYSNAPDS